MVASGGVSTTPKMTPWSSVGAVSFACHAILNIGSVSSDSPIQIV